MGRVLKFLKSQTLGICSLSSLAFGAILFGFAACGSQHDDATVTSTKPTATPSAEPTAVATVEVSTDTGSAFWIGAKTSPYLVRYDGTGKRAQFSDLKKLMPDGGGISALSKLDSNTIIAFLNPTGGTQKLATFDISTGIVKSETWFSDAANFSGVTVNSIHAVGGDSVFASKYAATSSGVERILHTASSVFRVPRTDVSTGLATSWIGASTTSPCVTGVIKGSVLVTSDSQTKLLMLSSGTGSSLLNLYKDIASAPTCETAFDYGAAGQPTSSLDIPVAATFISGSIYVLYAGAVPKIIGYDFDGTTLTNPTLITADAALLGTAPRAMANYTSNSVIVANNTLGAVLQIKVKGTGVGSGTFSVNEFFTSDIGALLSDR